MRLSPIAGLAFALSLAGCPQGGLGPGPFVTADLAGCDGCTAPTGCTSDARCGGATPRCDINSAQSVACLPTNDNCQGGTRCLVVGGAYTCSHSCTSDPQCPAPDAGGAAHCCSSVCVDVSSDPNNCGACGAQCAVPAHAT